MNEVPTLSDVLLLPGILIFLGVVVYGVAYTNALQGGALPRYRWVSMLFVALAFLASVGKFWELVNPATGPFYQQMLVGQKKVLIAHYVGPVLPVLCVALVILLEVQFKRHSNDE